MTSRTRISPNYIRFKKGIHLLRLLVGLGAVTLLGYWSWWTLPGHLSSPVLVLACVLAILYTAVQFAGNWLLYLAALRPKDPPIPNPALTVDIFVTAYKEPEALIERALAAACAVRGPHRTWLLDDGNNIALKTIANHLGAGYLTRSDRTDGKAGNINAAVPQTDGEIISFFDVDHFPEPDFLERTIGHFNDDRVGFVQVMLSFRNAAESWVARASAESALDFYYPTSIGADRLKAATMVGTNSLIRRSALQSINGYRSGLADDLATSIVLSAAGWHSVYVAEPLAFGLTPSDLPGWFLQQFKWARGVAEVVLTLYPRLFARLSWAQRISYSLRGSYYLFGLFVAVHFFLTLFLLFNGNFAAQAAFQHYLLYLFPLTLAAVLIRQFAMNTWHNAKAPTSRLTSILTGAIHLIFATWPVYMLAWVLAFLRVPIGYRPTPKSANKHFHPLWVAPQFLAFVLLAGSAVYALSKPAVNRPWLLIIFALLQCVPLVVVLIESVREAILVLHHSDESVVPEKISRTSEFQ